jgi:hypothetical protein
MELSPSWRAASCAATQELPKILWNSKVHYRVHKSPPLVPILRQINAFHTIPSYLRLILLLSMHLSLGLLSGFFPSAFTPISYMLPLLLIRATYPTHLILLDLITGVSYYRGEKYVSCTFSQQNSFMKWPQPQWLSFSSSFLQFQRVGSQSVVSV